MNESSVRPQTVELSIFLGPGTNHFKNRVFQKVDLAEILILPVLFLKTALKTLQNLPEMFLNYFFKLRLIFSSISPSPSHPHPFQNLDIALRFPYPVPIPQNPFSHTKKQ